MEFRIEREPFLRALSRLQSVAERRTTRPILGHALLEATEEGLTLSATDEEVSLRAITPVEEVTTPGAVAVSARKLFEIVRELPDETLRARTEEGGRLSIACGRARFTLVSLPADEFPAIPEADAARRITLPGPQLADMIARTHFAMSQDETRFILNGILVHLQPHESGQGGRLSLAATDTHRLAVATRDIEETIDESLELILPRKAVQEAKKLLDEDDLPVELALGEHFIQFIKPGLTLSAKLVSGRFPSYQKVIPAENPFPMDVDKEALLGVVRRMMVLSHEKSRGIRVLVEPEQIAVSAHNPEQEAAEEEMVADYNGDAMTIGFNARYLQEIVTAMAGDRVRFMLKNEESPVLMREAGRDDCMYVLMPMRV
ncbi:DNA polymerase III subunit beta [Magnetofaba australis]|uniref:Beta sliding clamp n=1 Tax=Magnetofaba australis IT-1 TaxID=1434232 RepID=A0A1Y2JZX3_9PROT|nr:DNA polymerase III subunit beta [Magnetofaba australis]OSM00467.1 putative DNA polymerase III subunit beta [Magnetofaba australis IT-1]